MSKLFIGYAPASNPETRQANGWNAVLVDAASAAAAKTAAIAAKPDGSTSDDNVNAWTFAEIAGTAGTLPNGSTVLWLGDVRGLGTRSA